METFTFKPGIIDYVITNESNACQKITKFHDNYELFCLRNRLAIYTEIEFVWHGNEIYITCKTDDPEKIQKLINRIVNEDPKFCILFPNNFEFPTWWLNEVLYYVNIPEKYFPYVGKHGLKITIPDLDYHTVFNNINLMVYNALKKMYKNGFIVSTDTNFNNKWQLIPASSDGKLVKPSWKDSRIQNMIEFLKSRMLNQQYNFKYFKDHLINPEDLNETRAILSKIMENELVNANLF